jgi:hypothetical protein
MATSLTSSTRNTLSILALGAAAAAATWYYRRSFTSTYATSSNEELNSDTPGESKYAAPNSMDILVKPGDIRGEIRVSKILVHPIKVFD